MDPQWLPRRVFECDCCRRQQSRCFRCVRCQSRWRIQRRIECRSTISGEIGRPSACHRMHHAVDADHAHAMIPAVRDEQVAPGVERETRGRVELGRRRGGFIPENPALPCPQSQSQNPAVPCALPDDSRDLK